MRAKNFNGFGLQSPESEEGALIVAKPTAPSDNPLRNHVTSTETSIVVEMPEVGILTTGGLPIISYALEWNSGGTQESNWSALVGTSTLSTSRTFTQSGLSTG